MVNSLTIHCGDVVPHNFTIMGSGKSNSRNYWPSFSRAYQRTSSAMKRRMSAILNQ